MGAKVSKAGNSLMYLWEDGVMQTYATLCLMGGITSEIEKDYLEFCRVARETFNEIGDKFNVFQVYAKLPDNKWAAIYRECVSQGRKQRLDFLRPNRGGVH